LDLVVAYPTRLVMLRFPAASDLAEEAVRCQTVAVERGAEYSLGMWLAISIAGFGVVALSTRVMLIKEFDLQKPSKNAPPIFETVLAAIMAYGFYLAAAFQADAEFPQFLRDHLFDGLALAALAGLLVKSFPRNDPRAALPWIRWPFLIPILFAVGGAMIFGLIGATAVFSSGSNDFWPAGLCALCGGLLFPQAYGQAISFTDDLSGWRPRLKWWFKNRSNDTAATATDDTATLIHEDTAPADSSGSA
jgi:hypothetical protein